MKKIFCGTSLLQGAQLFGIRRESAVNAINFFYISAAALNKNPATSLLILVDAVQQMYLGIRLK
jgi:hypothetical protein